MKFTVKNTKNKRVKVKDYMGKTIPLVFSYNTKTKMTGLYLQSAHKNNGYANAIVGKKNGKSYVVKVNIVIPGSYAEVNGKVVK